MKLVKPTMAYARDIMSFRQEILDANDDHAFAGCGNLGDCASADEWIKTLAVLENEATCPKGNGKMIRRYWIELEKMFL